jgi:hypothetical protein
MDHSQIPTSIVLILAIMASIGGLLGGLGGLAQFLQWFLPWLHKRKGAKSSDEEGGKSPPEQARLPKRSVSPERLLQASGELTDEARLLILGSLRRRWWLVSILVGMLGVGSILSWLAYALLLPPTPIPLPELRLASVERLRAEQTDPFIKSNPIFFPVVFDLEMESKGEPYFSTVLARTPPLGEFTDGQPIADTKCTLSFPDEDFDFMPPYVLLMQGDIEAGSFESLSAETEEGQVTFTVPESKPSDSILVIGGLVGQQGPLPKNLLAIFKMEVQL